MLVGGDEDPLSSDGLGSLPIPPPNLEHDPYYVFRDELAMLTRRALARFSQWNAALEEGTTYTDEFQNDNAFLLKTIASLKDNVRQLSKVLNRVERDRSAFPDLTTEEIADRKKFLVNVEHHCKTMSDALSSSDTLKMIERHAHEEKKRRSEAMKRAALLKREAISGDLEEPLRASSHVEHQALILKEQDEVLDDISESLGTLSNVGGEIGTEIKHHNVLLNGMQYETDSVMGRYEGVMKRLDTYMELSSRGQTCGVLFLIVVLIVLVLLVSLT